MHSRTFAHATDCNAFWPAHGETVRNRVNVSEHQPVWLDVIL